MLGAVDVGGGTRGIYGAGVLDYCLDKGIVFDHFVGVSAGSANGVSYLAHQRGRNYVYYDDYAFRKEYMSAENFLKTGSFIGLDYIYSTLSNEGGEYPVDYEAFMENPAGLEIVATDVYTGGPVYFQKRDIQKNHYEFLKASCCVPILDKPYPIGNRAYIDGGVSDPIPWRRAMAAGCDRLVIILTRPKTQQKQKGKNELYGRMLGRKYPMAGRALSVMHGTYNRQLREIKELEEEGMVLIVAPDDIGELKTLTQDHAALEALYQKGYRDAQAIEAFLEA